MRILLTGATGFIGSSIMVALQNNGHEVIACVHCTKLRLPAGTHAIVVDYMRDLTAAAWLPRLAGVEVVINAVGILREGTQTAFAELHHLAPRALFQACEQSGVGRVIQISALGADAGAVSRYYHTKQAADNDLRASTLAWTIVQPSVVFGPRGASTLLFLRLASLPVIPLVGRGEQRMQPIHIDDLVAMVIKLIEHGRAIKQTVVAVGPVAISMRTMLAVYRKSLGLGKAIMLPVPLVLIRLAARAGDVLKNGALSTETLRMLLNGNTGPVAETQAILGYAPRALNDFITMDVANTLRVQAVWSWLRPLLLASIAMVWLMAGVMSWVFAHDQGLALLAMLGLSSDLAAGVFITACSVNIILGVATLLVPGRGLWWTQLVVMVVYTFTLSWVAPALWVDPFGALVKNLPLAVVLLGLIAVPAKA